MASTNSKTQRLSCTQRTSLARSRRQQSRNFHKQLRKLIILLIYLLERTIVRLCAEVESIQLINYLDGREENNSNLNKWSTSLDCPNRSRNGLFFHWQIRSRAGSLTTDSSSMKPCLCLTIVCSIHSMLRNLRSNTTMIQTKINSTTLRGWWAESFNKLLTSSSKTTPLSWLRTSLFEHQSASLSKKNWNFLDLWITLY